MPGPDGQPVWKSAAFDLQSDGVLRWKSDEPWPWDAGAIDVKKALGVWLLGPPGWRRLDIILPEHRWTLAADGEGMAEGSGYASVGAGWARSVSKSKSRVRVLQ